MSDGQDMSDPGVFSLTPDQASQKLAEMAAALHGPAPSATPQNAGEARARLQALAGDSKWYANYVRGDQATRAEFDQLTRLASGGEQEPIGLIETVDSVTDPQAVSRATYAALLDGLRENTGGLP